MEKSRQFVEGLGYPSGDLYNLPTSTKRFPDGAQYRIEIPSVEGIEALRAVFDEADKLGIEIHRVSQGSGIMLLSDDEIRQMGDLCSQRQVELSLFVGPRGTWDISAQQFQGAGGAAGLRHEGMDQLIYAIEDMKRVARLGIRGALVGDEGLLKLSKELKLAGELPKDFVVKCSVQMMASNPVSIKILEELGADTYNVPTALTLPKLASIRSVIDIPIDIYIEVPDTLGGFLRYYEIPEIIRVLSPVYIKFGLRNHPDVYPSGKHLEKLNLDLARERVNRANIGIRMIKEYFPEARVSMVGALGLGIPLLQGGL